MRCGALPWTGKNGEVWNPITVFRLPGRLSRKDALGRSECGDGSGPGLGSADSEYRVDRYRDDRSGRPIRKLRSTPDPVISHPSPLGPGDQMRRYAQHLHLETGLALH